MFRQKEVAEITFSHVNVVDRRNHHIILCLFISRHTTMRWHPLQFDSFCDRVKNYAEFESNRHNVQRFTVCTIILSVLQQLLEAIYLAASEQLLTKNRTLHISRPHVLQVH